MLKIGDFSRLGNVTVKALRHYAEIGLLRPAWIDRFTGYRYYTASQLPLLNRILALKDLGFSLDEIIRLVRDDLPIEHLRAIIQSKQQDLSQRVQQDTSRLAQVEARLRLIETEGRLPQMEVVLKRFSPQVAALVRGSEEEDRESACLHLRQQLEASLSRAGIIPVGPWFRQTSEVEEAEIAVVLAGMPPARTISRLPADVHLIPYREDWLAASVMLPEDALDLTPAYLALLAWIEQNGYQTQGVFREVLLDEGSTSVDNCRVIEVIAPVTRADPSGDRVNFSSSQKENEMFLRFEERPAFMVLGMRFVGKFVEGAIPKLWGDFNKRTAEIKDAVWTCAYGVCIMENGMPEGEFEYLAGYEVKSVTDLPEGMVVRIIPAQKYAVFAHRGSAEALQATYTYIHQTWLSTSGHHHTGGAELEVYNEDFKDFAPDSVFYIYIPVQ